MEESRTQKVAQNVWWGMVTQIVTILLSFVSRTIFIKILGIEYLGVNGLFTNILTILSFAEMGIGNAIVYSMYKPLAINDKSKIKALMNFYAKAYRTIGFIVLGIGLLVIPFFDFVIKDTPNISENLIFIYILFLINTTLSYFYVYKKSIIIADQKNYIVSLYQQIFLIIQVIFQIIFLFLTHNYVMFLVIQIIFTLLNNIFTGKKANELYPYLKNREKEELEESEKKKIYEDVKALFLYKVASVVLSGTDNIIISSIIGITAVGLTSNYLLVINAFTNITNQIMNAFTASVGNLNTTEDTINQEKVFNKMFLISNWMYGFITIGIMLLINEFITLWIADEFVLSTATVLALSLNFYLINIHKSAYIYRTTMGFFVEGRFAPLVAAILNIVLSIFLGVKFGLAGIFIATSISRMLTIGIIDPILVYRKGFKKSPKIYFIKLAKSLLSVLFIYYTLLYVINFITVEGISGFMIRILIVSVLYNLFMLLVYRNSVEYKELLQSILKLFQKKGEKYE